MLGLDHPWFAPLPRRIATVALAGLWFGMELYGQNPFWMILSGATTALTIWKLLIAFKIRDEG